MARKAEGKNALRGPYANGLELTNGATLLWIEGQASLLGGCCGTDARHVAALWGVA